MKKHPRTDGHRSGKQDRRPSRFSRELAILYEDDAVVALNKPAGLLAVPVKGSDTSSALSLLSAELKPKRQRTFVVHRIDRFTSGVLLFAKTEPDRDALVRQFLGHTPVRQYLAVVRGHLGTKEGTLVHYFRREGMFQRLTTDSDSKAARAELRYSVERPLRAASLVRVTLVTGLQNQIRVQFSAIGHPVIGDRKYYLAEAWNGELLASLFMQGIFSSFIHARETASPLTANSPRTFRLFFRHYGCQPAGVDECSSDAVLSREPSPEHPATSPLTSGSSYSGGGTSEYSTGLRATERVSRELTTALGIQAARATVGVLG